ncbi:MAG TPA: tripartite tricarboxylate transporter substrate binding protein [Xanthobacteraceae bacterium]|nr:tripartite tricarboxylate transporter substrate binding protein [Xanthobacteraceae bacterium]
MPGMRLLACVLVIALGATAAAAQPDSFPNRPIKIVSPFAAGTSVDITARRIGDAMAPLLGQPVVVENKGGAGGSIGTEMVAKAAPDGHTLVLGTIGSHAFNVSLYRNLPYHPLKDFAPITRTVYGGFNTLLVHPSLPANNMREFIALAKEREAQGKPLTFGSSGVGSVGHLLVELIKQATGIKAVHVPYKGSSLIVADVIGGHVDFFIAAPSIAIPQVAGKTLKAVAVDSAERSRYLPDVPTMRETGLNNVEAQIWLGLFAPAGTPASVVAKLHAATLKVLAMDQVKADFDKDGLVILTDPSPEAFRKVVAEDIDKWGRVIKAAGIQPQ